MKIQKKNFLHGSMKNKYIKNIGVLTVGTALSQGLLVLVLPVLTRIYSPEDFNLLAIYVSILGLITVFSCLRYNLAIPLPERDEDGALLVLVSLFCSIVVSAISLVPFVFFNGFFANLLGLESFEEYMWVIPIGIFVASVYNSFQYWATRKREFGLIAKTRISRGVGGSGSQLIIGLISPSALGLIIGHTFYVGFGILGLWKYFVRSKKKQRGQDETKAAIRVAKEYKKFPIFSVPEAILNSAGVQLPIIIIAAASAGPEAGYLMLAMRVMGMPMTLVGQSIAQVFLSEAPGKLKQGNLGGFTQRTVLNLLKVGIGPFVLVGAVSPILFPIIFGSEWGQAGELVAWMTPWFILQFISSPVSMVLHVKNQVAIAFFIQIFGFVIRVFPLIFLLKINSHLMAEAFAVSSAAFYAIYIYVVIKVSAKS